jgi:hypothetical protein
MKNAHEQTPEQLALNANDDLARNRQFVRLGVAVLLQALDDATLPVPDESPAITSDRRGADHDKRHKVNAKRAERDSARAFLTTESPMLSFWCWVSGLHTTTLLRYARRAAADNRWTELGRGLRSSFLLRNSAQTIAHST